MMHILLGNTYFERQRETSFAYFATGVCLSVLSLSSLFWHLLLSRQAPYFHLTRNICVGLGSDSLLKKVASNAHDVCFIPSVRKEQDYLIPSVSEEQTLFMRAWMTGIILAIFGLWLATI